MKKLLTRLAFGMGRIIVMTTFLATYLFFDVLGAVILEATIIIVFVIIISALIRCRHRLKMEILRLEIKSNNK